MDIRKLINVEVDGIDTKDYPDFCDAYISYAEWMDSGTALTEEELDELNVDHGDFVYENVMDTLF